MQPVCHAAVRQARHRVQTLTPKALSGALVASQLLGLVYCPQMLAEPSRQLSCLLRGARFTHATQACLHA